MVSPSAFLGLSIIQKLLTAIEKVWGDICFPRMAFDSYVSNFSILMGHFGHSQLTTISCGL
jgi:hypothetical protein